MHVSHRDEITRITDQHDKPLQNTTKHYKTLKNPFDKPHKPNIKTFHIATGITTKSKLI